MTDRIALPEPPADQREVLAAGGVAVWRQPVEIGTYEPADPTPFPMFLDRRVYQGSSGRVYPLPFIERIGRERRPRVWDAIHLENRWIRLMLLPELGGRIHIGYDKTTGYDFFYRNNVIKPALVGLAGPWISGGVEFNWPQHHRPGTFLPVETEIQRHVDGSVVVWHSDHEPFARMVGSHGVLLRPESSLLELQVRLHNRTALPQTFLWWANVAARSSDHYQSFFPTDVRFVADHARRAVTAFPRADRSYYGVDYPTRVTAEDPDADRIDFYWNIPVPTSYMVLESEDEFFGGYDHDADAGFVHWADRRIAPGKKQWTWGNAAFGHAWDRLLTDADGPYVELMAGVFTDNQPDFSYLGPDEVRTFSQYWYPISRVGVVQQATPEAALSLRVDRPGVVRLGTIATRVHEVVEITLSTSRASTVLTTALAPDAPFVREVQLAGADAVGDVVVTVRSAEAELVHWAARGQAVAEPDVATEPPAPEAITSSEEVYLTGVHLRQYRHPTRSADIYFDEVLRRDPDDSRANLAKARSRLDAADYPAAEEHARRAIARLTALNPNPADGEAFYLLGVVLSRTGRDADAGRAFAKAAWDAKWAAAANLGVALLAARAGAWDEVLTAIDAAGPSARTGCIRVTALRALGRPEDADTVLTGVLLIDPLDAWARALAGGTPRDAWTAVDVAIEAEAVGDVELAHRMLRAAAAEPPGPAGNAAPIASYLAALFYERAGEPHRAELARSLARRADARLCHPSGLDAEAALRAALASEPDDARARALLATWLYAAGRRVEALAEWRRVIREGAADEVTLRNAAVAAVNVAGAEDEAAGYYDRAVEVAPRQSRLWMERDALAERRGISAEGRLAELERRPADAVPRDDLLVTTAELQCRLGRFSDAHDLLRANELQPWEGGEGRAVSVWESACLGLARSALTDGDHRAAIGWTEAAIATPPSLGEARHLLAGTAEIMLVRGDALSAAGDAEAARVCWRSAAEDPAISEETTEFRQVFWSGIGALRLGDDEIAALRWAALDRAAETMERSGGAPDYFATSLPSTLLFDLSPTVVRKEAEELRDLARRGRAASLAAPPPRESRPTVQQPSPGRSA